MFLSNPPQSYKELSFSTTPFCLLSRHSLPFIGWNGDIVFVVDLNPSMIRKLRKLKRAVYLLLRKRSTVKRLESFYKRFVLVAYDNTKFHASYFTRLESFYEALSSLTISKDQYCTAKIYSSLQHVIRHVRKHSLILLFTDSSPKEPNAFDTVQISARNKKVQITVISFGTCNHYSRPTANQLRSLALSSGGSYYSVIEERTSWVSHKFSFSYFFDAYIPGIYNV